GLHRLEIFQPFDRFLHSLEIREQSAKPALIHVELATFLSFFANSILSLTFSAYEKNGATFVLSNLAGDKSYRLTEHPLSFLQIDNVNAVALAKDVFLHLWIPAPHLVTEVNTGLQQLFHRNRNHTISFC